MVLLDALGPPVEARGRADEIGARREGNAAGEVGIRERLDGGDVAVDEGVVGQRIGIPHSARPVGGIVICSCACRNSLV